MAIPDSITYVKGIELEDPIYKYLPLAYVLNMYDSKKIRISNVLEWEDVYENYFLKQNLQCKGQPIDTKNAKECFFGMSWTAREESDAMWRIYSNYAKGLDNVSAIAVRVKSTVRKLLETFWGEAYDAPALIYKVKYDTQNNIEQHLQHLAKSGNLVDQGEEIRKGLYTKRIEFQHEEEVRAIIGVDMKYLNEYCKYIEIQFTPDNLFEEFIIDPRVTHEQEAWIWERLLSVGINKNRISKSQLYAFTPRTIELYP